jgi:hypothetical protein
MDQSEVLKIVTPSYTDEQIERMLREEIWWTIHHGPGWDPDRGAHLDLGKWKTMSDGCGTCAIGALLLHRQPASVTDNNVVAAAKLLGRPFYWTEQLFYSVADKGPDIAETDAEKMGHRLRDYGNELADRHYYAKNNLRKVIS